MQTLNLAQTPEKKVIATAISTLQNGGLIIFPTETVYGAGVDATNQTAVDKLLTYKSRREGKPLSIAVSDETTAAQYVALNSQAKKLYQRFLPGPVTVVSNSKGQVAQGVESEFGTLGVRIPAHELMLKILGAFGQPVTATSANASGQKRPYTIADILHHLSDKQKSLIDLVLDAGQLPKNEPSTVIDTTLSTPTTLRSGQIKFKADQTLISHSETETKKIAGTLLFKYWEQLKNQGLVIGLDGSLGVGKTIFTKGIAEFLHISDTITSPTYSYLATYEYRHHGVSGQLHHLDLWKIETPQELARLKIDQLLGPRNAVIIEWWAQGGEALQKLVADYQDELMLLRVQIQEENDKAQRKLAIKT